MKFLIIQLVIMLTIIISGILGGKKGAVLASIVWMIETFAISKVSVFSNLQFGIIAISFQVGISVGVFKDYIGKKIRERKISTK